MATQIDDAQIDDTEVDEDEVDDDLGAQDDADKDKPKGKPADKADPFAALRGKDLTAADAGEKSAREAKESGFSEAVEKFEPLLVKASAIPALQEAGATSGFDSLVRLFDKDKIVVNDDGSVDGVDAEVKRLKKEFPGMFPGGEVKRPVRKTAYGSRADGGDKSKGGAAAPKSAAQRHADRILGKSDD
jgi:hypothetical protein